MMDDDHLISLVPPDTLFCFCCPNRVPLRKFDKQTDPDILQISSLDQINEPPNSLIQNFVVAICTHCSKSLPILICTLCHRRSKRGNFMTNKHLQVFTWLKKHVTEDVHVRRRNAPDAEDDTNFNDDSEDEGLPFIRSSFPETFGMTAPMANFFERERYSPNSGIRFLVAKAFDLDDLSPAILQDRLQRPEIHHHLQTTLFCISLTRSMQNTFGEILSAIPPHYSETMETRRQYLNSVLDLILADASASLTSSESVRIGSILRRSSNNVFHGSLPVPQQSSESHPSIFQITNPAISVAQVQTYYLRSTKSIYGNIPAPSVHMTADRSHAYVHAKEICSFFFACRFESLIAPSYDIVTESIQSKKIPSFHQSPKAYEILQGLGTDTRSSTLTIFIKEWSDDAQKNHGQRSNNLLSFNLRTITFLTPGKNGDPRLYTFVLSLSLKGQDHSEVEKILHDELRELRQPHVYFSGHHQRWFRGTVHLVAGVRDRPATGEATGLGAQNSTFGKRMRFAALLDSHTDGFLSCKYCYLARRKYLNRHPSLGRDKWSLSLLKFNAFCSRCMDLEYVREHDASQILMLDGAVVASDEENAIDGTTVFVPLDFSDDKSPVASLVYRAYSPSLAVPIHYNEKWQYPTRLAVGSPPTPAHRPVGPMVSMIEPMELRYDLLKQAFRVAVYNYHSRSWNKTETRTYLKTMAVNNAVTESLFELSRSMSGRPASEVADSSSSIMPTLWHRTDIGHDLPMELEAVFHCVHHGVTMNTKDVLELVFREMGIRSEVSSLWNDLLLGVKDLQQDYLQVLQFGMRTEDSEYFKTTGWIGTHKVGLLRVLPYLMAAVPGTSELFDLACETVISLFCFVSRFLTLEVCEQVVFECNEYAKHFICNLTNLEMRCGTPPSYLATGNVTSLLNIPGILERYGSMRFFWDLIDEKAVQKIKGQLSNLNMTSDSWLSAILEQVTKRQALQMVSVDFSLTDDDYDNPEEKRRFRLFRLPLLPADLDQFGNRPFNVLHQEGRFFVPFRLHGQRSRDLTLVPMIIVNSPTWIRSVPFFTFSFLPTAKTYIDETSLLTDYKSAEACPCLPLQDSRNPDHHLIVTILHADQKWWTGCKFELPNLHRV